MSIQEQKITEAAVAANGVQSQPDKLTGTAAQNKKVFDNLVTAVVKARFNALIDELTGAGAAGQLGITTIPGYSAATVQAALEQIVKAMQEITQGSVADKSITLAKLAAEVTAVALGGAAASHNHGAANITSGTLAAARIPVLDASKLGAGSVGTAQLGAAVVTSEKLAALAVLATHIAAGAVTTPKIAAKAVTAAKIANDAVQTANLGDGVVTRAKLAQDAIGKKVDWSANSSPIKAQYNNYFIYMRNSIAKSFTITAEDFAALPDGYTLTILALASSPVTISWASGIPVMDAVQRTEDSSGGGITLGGNGDMVTIFKRPADGSSIAAGLILTGQLNPRTIWVGSSTTPPSTWQPGDIYLQYE